MLKPFIVIEIGCIECQETTYYRGQFRTRAEAKVALDAYNQSIGIDAESPYASRRQVIFDLRSPDPIGTFPE